jgi:hypothetical protein
MVARYSSRPQRGIRGLGGGAHQLHHASSSRGGEAFGLLTMEEVTALRWRPNCTSFFEQIDFRR